MSEPARSDHGGLPGDGGTTGPTIDLNDLHASAELSIADAVVAGYKVDPPELPVEGIAA